MVRSGEWGSDLRSSLFRYGIGFVLGNLIGILLGVVTGRIQAFRDSLGPLLNFLRNTPSVAIIPLAKLNMNPEDRIERIRRASEVYDSGCAKDAADDLLTVEFTANEKDSKLYATYCVNLGSALAESGRFQLAIKYFTEAEKYYEMSNLQSDLGLIFFNLGNVHRYIIACRVASSYYSKALEYFRRVGDVACQVTTHLTFANFLADIREFDAANG